MTLTEQQRKFRAIVFPGKRGKLNEHDQKIFAQLCAEKGFPLEETTKPTSIRRAARRASYKDATSDEEPDIDDVDDGPELEEVVETEQQEEEPLAGTRRTREVKTEVNAASDEDYFSDPRWAPAPAATTGTAKLRRRSSGRKGGRLSVDTAAQALIRLTGSKPPQPAAAAAGRQRIAAALPGAGFKPFAGVAMALGSRQGSGAGQRCDAPYDYYDVYHSYLNCMELYSKAAGRLGPDAVAAPIPPEELLGPAYASHLSTDPKAPHWTPPTAALEADGDAVLGTNAASDRAARAAARAAAAAVAAGNPDRRPAADTGGDTATGGGRGKRKKPAGVGDAVQAAAKRPYNRRSAAHTADAAAATGDADQEAADDQQGTAVMAVDDTAPQGAAAAAALHDRLEHRMNGTNNHGSPEHDARSGSTVPLAAAAAADSTLPAAADAATGGSSDVEMVPAQAAAAARPQSEDAGAAETSDSDGSKTDREENSSDISDDSDSSSDSGSERDGGDGHIDQGGSPDGDDPQQQHPQQQLQRQEQDVQQQKAPSFAGVAEHASATAGWGHSNGLSDHPVFC